MMMGTGFAPFRGGPLRFADHFGLKEVVAQLDALHSHGGRKVCAVRSAPAARRKGNQIL
jgi:hypothetical protein